MDFYLLAARKATQIFSRASPTSGSLEITIGYPGEKLHAVILDSWHCDANLRQLKSKITYRKQFKDDITTRTSAAAP